eukprot:CAMPEP_0198200198 /NCGR_PEP_ID=MMETSP1445-20131203/3244_1 /TAXON_ID=36898 /ORGANISM="Pyramimonas sp., Strain CCMP2087" /LENGTH=200 /DNA_ID=CAMNT_0043870175 /DNA_START=81 /DNA_END=679 /DNA_ORIENTATION=-
MELSKQQQKGISNYEAERNKRIEENHQTMIKFGIFTAQTNLQKTIEAETRPTRIAPRPPRVIKPRAFADNTPMRRSLRAQSMPVPRYLDLQSQDISMEERISKEMKRRIESDGMDSHSTTKILRAKIKNQHKKEWLYEEGVMATASEAEKAVLLMGNMAFVKLILPSHMSGGYWLQAPYGLKNYLPSRLEGCWITLVCEG